MRTEHLLSHIAVNKARKVMSWQEGRAAIGGLAGRDEPAGSACAVSAAGP